MYRFLRFFLICSCRLFFHLEVRGRGFIPKKGGFVLASNHASFLDPILVGTACPRVLNFAARESLFRNKFFGWFITEMGSFPIKRWSADLSAVKESVRRLKNNAGLLVFPEGTRSQDGNIRVITGGFVMLAAKARVPIIPVWVSGSRKAWGKGSRFIKPAKIMVIFGSPVDVGNRRDYEVAAREVVGRIQGLSDSC
ncbi:MAG: lysophospholipid acyltransferase family protein [Candidatus Omnitrophota bacterium]